MSTRPTEITCLCGAIVPVGSRGKIPRTCRPCRRQAEAQRAAERDLERQGIDPGMSPLDALAAQARAAQQALGVDA